jgi:hypothetical protein
MIECDFNGLDYLQDSQQIIVDTNNFRRSMKVLANEVDLSARRLRIYSL